MIQLLSTGEEAFAPWSEGPLDDLEPDEADEPELISASWKPAAPEPPAGQA